MINGHTEVADNARYQAVSLPSNKPGFRLFSLTAKLYGGAARSIDIDPKIEQDTSARTPLQVQVAGMLDEGLVKRDGLTRRDSSFSLPTAPVYVRGVHSESRRCMGSRLRPRAHRFGHEPKGDCGSVSEGHHPVTSDAVGIIVALGPFQGSDRLTFGLGANLFALFLVVLHLFTVILATCRSSQLYAHPLCGSCPKLSMASYLRYRPRLRGPGRLSGHWADQGR